MSSARETNLASVISACNRVMELDPSHPLHLSDSRAIAKLVLSAIDPPPSRLAVLTVAAIDECAAELGAAALKAVKRSSD